MATTLIDASFRLPGAADYVVFVRESASPIQQILGALDDAARQRARQDIERRLQRFETAGGFVDPNEFRARRGARLTFPDPASRHGTGSAGPSAGGPLGGGGR